MTKRKKQTKRRKGQSASKAMLDFLETQKASLGFYESLNKQWFVTTKNYESGGKTLEAAIRLAMREESNEKVSRDDR